MPKPIFDQNSTKDDKQNQDEYSKKPPEFTADEINCLRSKTYKNSGFDDKKISYYKKCLSIVEQHEAGDIHNYYSKQINWLWVIKRECRDELKSQGNYQQYYNQESYGYGNNKNDSYSIFFEKDLEDDDIPL